MKNKRAKQMICDVVLQGRKAIWYGDESEVFAANSIEQIEKEFGQDEEFKDEHKNVVSSNWKYWWTPCVSEKEWSNKYRKHITKGGEVKDKKGNVIECYERLPLICGVYGGADDVAQVLTSYN